MHWCYSKMMIEVSQTESWGECSFLRGGVIQREKRSSARCYCPVCQSLEKENKESWWALAYHMSTSLILTLCSVIHSHTPHIHNRRCDSSASGLSPNPLPQFFLFFILYPHHPLEVSPVFTISRSVVHFFFWSGWGFEQVEGRPTGS